MAKETLQGELMAVPGVTAAEMDVVDGELPAGVKVSLSPDADAGQVGIEVQRVLAAHGMRSRFSSGDVVSAKSASEEFSAASIPQVSDRAKPEPGVPVPSPPTTSAPSIQAVPQLSPGAPQEEVAVSGVRSVSIEERPDGLTAFVVLADGRQASRATGLDPEELDVGIIAAIAEAAGVVTTGVAVKWLEIEGVDVATVVVKRVDGSLCVGASIVQYGRAFAVGVATRSALES